MKVVILAGGSGGGLPILWHILKHYSFYGFNESIICCGYKGYITKEHLNVAAPWNVWAG